MKFSLVELFLYHFELLLFQNAEAVARKCSRKKIFLKILENSQKNICARILFSINFQPGGLQLYLKNSGTGVFKNAYFLEHL